MATPLNYSRNNSMEKNSYINYAGCSKLRKCIVFRTAPKQNRDEFGTWRTDGAPEDPRGIFLGVIPLKIDYPKLLTLVNIHTPLKIKLSEER